MGTSCEISENLYHTKISRYTVVIITLNADISQGAGHSASET